MRDLFSCVVDVSAERRSNTYSDTKQRDDFSIAFPVSLEGFRNRDC
jgi:hypothetical protein